MESVEGRKWLENISWSIPWKNVADPPAAEPDSSWSPIRQASNWATEAGEKVLMSLTTKFFSFSQYLSPHFSNGNIVNASINSSVHPSVCHATAS